MAKTVARQKKMRLASNLSVSIPRGKIHPWGSIQIDAACCRFRDCGIIFRDRPLPIQPFRFAVSMP